MTISRSRAVVLLFALALSGCIGRTDLQSEALARQFCAAVLKGDEAAAIALMTPDLQLQMAQLRLFDAAWQARNPGQKPPLGNGIRLTAWEDAPGTCTPGEQGRYRIELTYTPASAPADQWRDTLILLRVAGDLKVADIEFDPKGGGSLRGWVTEVRWTPG